MAVVIQHLCDHPVHGDDQVVGQPQPMLLPGLRKPRVVDLCDEHQAQYVKPLVDLFSEHGRIVDLTEDVPRQSTSRVTPGSEKPSETPCPAKDCDFVGYSRKSTQDHIKNKHDSDMKLLTATDPKDGEVCGYRGCTRRMKAGAAMARHKTAVHGARKKA